MLANSNWRGTLRPLVWMVSDNLLSLRRLASVLFVLILYMYSHTHYSAFYCRYHLFNTWSLCYGLYSTLRRRKKKKHDTNGAVGQYKTTVGEYIWNSWQALVIECSFPPNWPVFITSPWGKESPVWSWPACCNNHYLHLLKQTTGKSSKLHLNFTFVAMAPWMPGSAWCWRYKQNTVCTF